MNEHWMHEALLEASFAASEGEVPIGAVAVAEGELVAKAHNLREATQDPLGHAEILLIRKLSQTLESWRLEDVTVYVTCEPCLMCMGALIQARVPRLVFGCFEPKTGACGSLYNLGADKRLSHRMEVVSGVLENLCAAELKQFFAQLRNLPEERLANEERRTNYE